MLKLMEKVDSLNWPEPWCVFMTTMTSVRRPPSHLFFTSARRALREHLLLQFGFPDTEVWKQRLGDEGPRLGRHAVTINWESLRLPERSADSQLRSSHRGRGAAETTQMFLAEPRCTREAARAERKRKRSEAVCNNVPRSRESWTPSADLSHSGKPWQELLTAGSLCSASFYRPEQSALNATR